MDDRSDQTCHRQPAAASPIDLGRVPPRRGRFLVWAWSLARSRLDRLIGATFLCCTVFAFTSVAAQPPDGSGDSAAPGGKPEAPGRVEVQPVAQDDEIRQRIANILKTTGWFGDPEVTVQEGIVFLKGTAENEESQRWAGDLAKNTVGVVAVVNRIAVSPTTVWDFEPTFQVLNDLARGLIRLLPLIVVAMVVLAMSWLFARLTVSALRRRLSARSLNRLLREVMSRAGGIVVLLAGIYLVLRIAGLTQLALTVVGGTGLIGLVLGGARISS